MTRRTLSIVGYWIGLRVFLSIVILAASSSRPRTEIEKAIPAWPVSSPFGSWTQRVLLEPWNRWDVAYYQKIAIQGYHASDGTAQFHPLFPVLGRLAGALFGGNSLMGLLAINSVCGLLFLIAFQALASLDFPGDSPQRAALFLLHAPVAFILFAPYSEGLFLLCSVLLFLMARRGSWWLAGVAGGLAALTRQQGIFLLVPLAWEFWESCERDPRKLRTRWRTAMSVLLVPIGLLVWLLYRALALSDLTFEVSNPRTWIYGLLISKDSSKVVSEQGFMMPWKVLASALKNPQSTTIIDLILASSFILMFVIGAVTLWRVRRSYFFYVCLILLVSFSYYTGTYQPYMGLSRHCLLAFPLFMPLGVVATRPRIVSFLMGCGLLGAALLTYCYGAQILWVP